MTQLSNTAIKQYSNKYTGLIQFIKFGIVGVANTGVDWVVFYLLINFASLKTETIAKAIAFLVALLNSYFWNTIWTFKKEYKESQDKKATIFVKFLVVGLIGWGINVFVFDKALGQISFQLLNNKELLPLIFASGAAILWNFFANKHWTYKK